MKKSKKIHYWMPVVLSFLLLFFLHGYGLAESSILWGGLQPGPHAVGFRTVEKYDYSRAFRSKFDYFGTLQTGERARPIQICIWYPAKPSPDAPTMVFGEYVFPNPDDPDFFALVSNLQQRELQFLGGLLRNRGFILDIMSLNMEAVKNAEPDSGKYPLIIYHPSLQQGFSENSVICEYLASNGYIVATSHSIGTTTINPALDAGDLETLIRDKEFIYGFMRDFPYVDTDKLGLLGYGFGGSTALLMQMRNSDVEAVVCLEGAFTDSTYFNFTDQNPYFNIKRMHVPFLQMCSDADTTFNLDLFKSLKYTPRYSLVFSGLPNINFTHYGLISALVMDSISPPPEIINQAYTMLCHYTLNFFNAYLDKNKAGRKFIDAPPAEFGLDPEFVSYEYFDKMDLPPTSEQFMAIINEQGAVEAGEIYDRFQKTDPGSITFPEAVFNAIGYQFLRTNRVDDAIIIFGLNADVYPNSANCWDSFADAYNALGDRGNALKCYRKVLEVLPNDPSTNEQLKQTIRTNAENALAESEEGGN